MGNKGARTRRRIVDHASRLLREEGVSNVSVDRAMAAAGLTRGGFYAHFDGVDALTKEAIRHAFGEAHANLFPDPNARGEKWRRSAEARYLTALHVDDPGHGCVVAALAADVAREGGPLRLDFERGVLSVLDAMKEKLGDATREEAIRIFSSWLGALVLARAMSRRSSVEEVLNATRSVKGAPRRNAKRALRSRTPARKSPASPA
jgi:TetR/AcrR family transcriptional repressor of nem operon